MREDQLLESQEIDKMQDVYLHDFFFFLLLIPDATSQLLLFKDDMILPLVCLVRIIIYCIKDHGGSLVKVTLRRRQVTTC
jgi:hypothetical protein